MSKLASYETWVKIQLSSDAGSVTGTCPTPEVEDLSSFQVPLHWTCHGLEKPEVVLRVAVVAGYGLVKRQLFFSGRQKLLFAHMTEKNVKSRPEYAKM